MLVRRELLEKKIILRAQLYLRQDWLRPVSRTAHILLRGSQLTQPSKTIRIYF
jgi:hypothetical protein